MTKLKLGPENRLRDRAHARRRARTGSPRRRWPTRHPLEPPTVPVRPRANARRPRPRPGAARDAESRHPVGSPQPAGAAIHRMRSLPRSRRRREPAGPAAAPAAPATGRRRRCSWRRRAGMQTPSRHIPRTTRAAKAESILCHRMSPPPDIRREFQRAASRSPSEQAAISLRDLAGDSRVASPRRRRPTHPGNRATTTDRQRRRKPIGTSMSGMRDVARQATEFFRNSPWLIRIRSPGS